MIHTAWGCGLPLSAKKLKQVDWHGKNYLGIILAECRFEIRRDPVIRKQQQSMHNTGHPSPTPPPGSKHNNVPTTTVKSDKESPKPTQRQGATCHPNYPTTTNQPQNFQPHNTQSSQLQQPQPWPAPMMFLQQGFPYPNSMPNLGILYYSVVDFCSRLAFAVYPVIE